jgi:CcmD family protein
MDLSSKERVSMYNLGYLFAALLVLWSISFALIASIAVRQKRLEREIDRLRKEQGDIRHD